MADELDPAIIKRTQETLGKYVKKPSLSDKLLKKPPFRFLHDVFSVVLRDTGCFVGLYTPEELAFENIKDRDDKMKFLQKMIDVVKIITGSPLTVRTSKIVAGHEPENTNQLLQLMGQIIEQKLDWQSAVEQVRLGKTVRKEPLRKPKDSSSNVAKDATKHKVKQKEGAKEKESNVKESKTTKSTSSRTGKTTGKNENSKTSKTKENTSTKLIAKERTSKSNKEIGKAVKNSTKEKSKFFKSETQSSNKSSPSPNIHDTKKNLPFMENETECKHEDENVEIATPPKKSSNSSISNDMTNADKTKTDNQKESVESNYLEKRRLSAEKANRNSAKSRKSRPHSEVAEDFGKKDLDRKILETTTAENTELPEAAEMTSEKPKIFASTSNKQETNQKLEIQSETSTVINSQQESFDDSQSQTQKQASAPFASNLTNEIKRESTFTRENSKESSSNSSLVNRPRTSLRPPSARPPSARPGAPRRRDKNIEIILQPNDQIKLSGIQVKLETFGDLDDDGENLVIIENPNANEVTIDQQSNLTESEKIMQDATLEQGHLVQQILETQKELVQQKSNANNEQRTDKDSTNDMIMRQPSARQMTNLRDVIQNLTKSVNPLGKLMDFIPEDIDAMQLEFTMWRDAYTQAANELKKERSLTDSATEPMKNQLVQIEANIAEYMEMIDTSRIKILQNSEKIYKMLTTP